MSDSVTIKVVTPAGTLTEGPHWEAAYGSLLYVDIRGCTLNRYFPESSRQQQLTFGKSSTGDTVSFVLPCSDDPSLLLVGHGRTLSAVRWSTTDPDHGTATPVEVTPVDVEKQTCFNDAKCDPPGRIWAGTKGFETSPGMPVMNQGSLFRFSPDLEATTCVEKIHLSNGLTWSNDGKILYYIDTVNLKVEAFDYCDDSGEISNRRTILDYPTEGLVPDLPDGMTTDVDGNLWVANYCGKKLICIDPTKKRVIRTIITPVPNPTSICWGGADYSTLYCTSSSVGLSPQQQQEFPESGAVFGITGLGTRGRPPVGASLSAARRQNIESRLK